MTDQKKRGKRERGEKGGGGLRGAWRYTMGTKEIWMRGSSMAAGAVHGGGAGVAERERERETADGRKTCLSIEREARYSCDAPIAAKSLKSSQEYQKSLFAFGLKKGSWKTSIFPHKSRFETTFSRIGEFF